MRILLIFFFLLVHILVCGQPGISVCSWNLKDFGQTKSTSEITFIAEIVKHYDILAIQEVVAGYGGAQAVTRLVDELNRKGFKWDYCISDPTYSSSYKSERYAFLWKTSRVKKIGDAWLEQKYKLEIDREPFYANFEFFGKKFTLVSFHAITKSKQPETEIKYFKFLPEEYPDKNLIFCGDFNCPQSHSVFNPLKKLGYRPIFINQKTTLRQICIGDDCLASEFDNIFYSINTVSLSKSGVVKFFTQFSNMHDANKISDHLPVYAVLLLN